MYPLPLEPQTDVHRLAVENAQLREQLRLAQHPADIMARPGDVANLIAERDALRLELKTAKLDLEAMEKHHALTEEIIADAQGLSPENGKALLFNMSCLRDEMEEAHSRLEVLNEERNKFVSWLRPMNLNYLYLVGPIALAKWHIEQLIADRDAWKASEAACEEQFNRVLTDYETKAKENQRLQALVDCVESRKFLGLEDISQDQEILHLHQVIDETGERHRKYTEELKENTEVAYERLEQLLNDKPDFQGMYVHLVTCNGERRVPVGTSGYCCSCPIGQRIKKFTPPQPFDTTP